MLVLARTIVLLGLLGTFASWMHPFYVTIIKLDHNPSSQSLQTTFKIFVDDLEMVLEQETATRLFLGTKREHENAELYVKRYLSNHFKVKANGVPLDLAWVGLEYENDLIWCYMEGEGVANPESIEVDVSVMVDALQGQTNIVHVKVGAEEQSEAFDSQFTQKNFAFK